MMQPEVAMATDFLAEVAVGACDPAAIEITNNFPFLSKLSRLSEVFHCGFPAPQECLPCTHRARYCISLVSFMTSLFSST